MKAWIVFYDMKNLLPKARVKAMEELFGKIRTSHKGKYSHTLKPKIEKFIRPIRAAIIVKNKDIQTLKDFLRSYGIRHRACQIEIKPVDFENQQFF